MTDTIILRKPGPALAPYVNSLWYFNLTRPASRPDKVLPHGAFELVISLKRDGNQDDANNLISGPHTGAMIVDPVDYSPLIGAHFNPGGAAALLGYPASDFLDLDVPLSDVWSNRATELRERLAVTMRPQEALSLLESTLSRLTERTPRLHPAVALAIDEFHCPSPSRSVRELVAESGLSHRRFIEVFRQEIGLPPKLYARIQRFQRTVRLISRTEHVDWGDLAYACGYADQAHLIREFRDFSGLRPSEYLPRWPDQPNHAVL